MNPLEFADAAECISGGMACALIAYFLGYPFVLARKILYGINDISDDGDD